MSLDSQIQVRPAGYEHVVRHLERITQLSTEAFLTNHEITRNAYARTAAEQQPLFKSLFEAHVADMMAQIHTVNGLFFIAEEGINKKIVAISVGRPYGQAALSPKFMESVFSSPCKFKEVMGDWWKLMEKFQVHATDAPPASVYHQAMTAVDPAYVGELRIGTKVSQCVMQHIQQAGFAALARETSSTRAHGVVNALKRHGVKVIAVDSVQNAPTGISLALRLQLTNHPDAEKVAEWFRKRL